MLLTRRRIPWISITTRKYVERKTWTTYDGQSPAGSGYCKDHYDRQYLIQAWYLGPLRIWSTVLDWEDVPIYASAQRATMGYTDWRSKFEEYI